MGIFQKLRGEDLMQVKVSQQRPGRTQKTLSGLGRVGVAGTMAPFECHGGQKNDCRCWRNWKLGGDAGVAGGCEGHQAWSEKQGR